MPNNLRAKGGRDLLVFATVVVVVVGAIVGVLFYRQESRPLTPTPSEQPKQVHVQVKKQPRIDYNRLGKDEALNAMMDKRKSEYGMDKGVDLIVKPDETIRIGDTTIPMQEILDRIRIQKGDITEKDVADPLDTERKIREREKRIKELNAAEARLTELEERLAASDSNPADQPLQDEAAALLPEVSQFRKYTQTLSAIEKVEKGLTDTDAAVRQASRESLQTLRMQKSQLERRLKIPDLPRSSSEIYGIHIVLSGDNIWNIHFQFLKDYFANRGVDLAPRSDEPDRRGFSSGVGKLLKFSENMVHIYNLKERRLDVDLNMLQPLTKIVVFNMGEVFALLDPIDYQRLGRVQFDGETLWIPAEP